MDVHRMILVVYKDQEGARKMHERLKEMEDENLIDIENAAVIVKEADGTVKVDDKADVEAGKGALTGTIVGALIGLLSGPGGAIVGAATGAVTGGASAALIDMGFDKDILDNIKADLRPNSSALIAVVDEEWNDRFEQSMSKEIGDSVSHYYHDVKAEVIEQWNRTKDSLN